VSAPYRDGPASAGEAARAPDVLICAGLDPSGGAGLIADVRVASMLGARPVGVVTALTIQNTQGVRSAHPLDADVVGAQIATLLSDIEVKAVKLGMLGAADIAREIADGLHLTAAPVVWDPISAPSLGDVSFDRDLFGEMLRELGPHLALITPNTGELAALAGRPIRDLDELVAAARDLAGSLGVAVLAKGGHAGGPESVDVLAAGDLVERLRSPRVAEGEHVHGTGCALSTAIAAHLALGAGLVDACRAAKELVGARIAAPVRPGRGAPAIV
jgi:hydroxymethylpyrimidine/phosphomethylpyrimidine kinase